MTIKNYDCRHLNNTSVVCKDLSRKAGKVLEKYIPFNIKNRGTLLQKPSQTPCFVDLSSLSSSIQKEYTQKLLPSKIVIIIIELGGFHHYYLIKGAEHISNEGATLKEVSTEIKSRLFCPLQKRGGSKKK